MEANFPAQRHCGTTASPSSFTTFDLSVIESKRQHIPVKMCKRNTSKYSKANMSK